MTKSKRKRMIKYEQKRLNRMFAYLLVMNVLIILLIVVTAFIRISQNNKIEGKNFITVCESIDNHDAAILPANVLNDCVKYSK